MGERTKRTREADGGVRYQLEHSAEAIKQGEDVDRVLLHISDATMHLGEARGYRNAIVDLLEDG